MPLQPIPNVPRPKVIRPEAEDRKYPLATMEVGAMVFVEGVSAVSLGAHVSRRGKALGRKFRTQQVYMRWNRGTWQLCDADERGAVRGVGVWRIS